MSSITEDAQRIWASLQAAQAAASEPEPAAEQAVADTAAGDAAASVHGDVSAELARVYAENVKLAQIASDALIRAHEIDAVLEELDRLREAAGVSVEDVVTDAVAPIYARLGEIDGRLDQLVRGLTQPRRRWWKP